MTEVICVKPPKSIKVKKTISNILKVGFLFLILFLMYLPIFIIGLISINADGTATDFTGVTGEWYVKLFNDSDLLVSIFKNTILVALISTLCSTIFGTLAAIGINSLTKKNRKRMIMLNNVPILNADIVTAVLLFIVFECFGLLIRAEFSIVGYPTLVLSHIFFSTPYVVLSVLPKLGEIDKNLYDAALDLGCKPKKAIWKVIVPAIKTGIFTGALLAFTMSIDDFVISYFVSSPSSRNFSTWFYASRKLSKGNSLQLAAAYNTLLTIVTITALVIYNVVKKKRKKSN